MRLGRAPCRCDAVARRPRHGIAPHGDLRPFRLPGRPSPTDVPVRGAPGQYRPEITRAGQRSRACLLAQSGAAADRGDAEHAVWNFYAVTTLSNSPGVRLAP